ncbi:MAG: TolB family protein [Ignavibacteria bacterium]
MRVFLLTIAAFLCCFAFSHTGNATEHQDKKLIAFSSDATDNDKQQIFIMDENGDGVKQVCHKNLNCISPRFSPDGRKIVFVGTNVVSDFIYMVDLDDTSSFRMPKFIDGGSDPQFSPDGKYLLYRSEKNLDNNVYIIDLTNDSIRIVSDGSLSTYAKFSPDGKKVLYSSSAYGNFDLVLMDLHDTSEDAQLTIAETQDAELYGTFSSDGKWISYSSFDIKYKGTLHVCNSDGSNNKTVSKGLSTAYNPKFSPDGSMLAFVGGSGDLDVYICSADGSGLKQLTSKSGNTLEFDWSGDGKKIVYEKIKEGVSSVNIINLETGKSEDLTGEKANNINPNFQK